MELQSVLIRLSHASNDDDDDDNDKLKGIMMIIIMMIMNMRLWSSLLIDYVPIYFVCVCVCVSVVRASL